MVPLYDVSALPNYAKACRKVKGFICGKQSFSENFLPYIKKICHYSQKNVLLWDLKIRKTK